MKKIIIVNASSRKGGNSLFIEGLMASELKNEDVEIFRISEKKVNYCLGCNICKAWDKPACIQKDDISDLIKRVDEADAIVLLSPIYFGQLSAQGKTFLDRMYCFFAPTKPNGCIASRTDKKVGIISCCGNGPTDKYLAYINETVRHFDIIGTAETRCLVLGGGNEAGSVSVNKEQQEQIVEYTKWLT